MTRLGALSAICVAGLVACGTQQPQFQTRADPGNRSRDLWSQTAA